VARPSACAEVTYSGEWRLSEWGLWTVGVLKCDKIADLLKLT